MVFRTPMTQTSSDSFIKTESFANDMYLLREKGTHSPFTNMHRFRSEQSDGFDECSFYTFDLDLMRGYSNEREDNHVQITFQLFTAIFWRDVLSGSFSSHSNDSLKITLRWKPRIPNVRGSEMILIRTELTCDEWAGFIYFPVGCSTGLNVDDVLCLRCDTDRVTTCRVYRLYINVFVLIRFHSNSLAAGNECL